MKVASFYHKDTGLFSGIVVTTTDGDEVVQSNCPADHLAMTGHHDHQTKRVDLVTGKVVDYMPDCPSDDHEWSEHAKRWVVRTDVQVHHLEQKHASELIATLETRTQPRAQRELLLAIAERLGVDGGRLKDLDTQIAAQRTVLNEPKPARPTPDQGH